MEGAMHWGRWYNTPLLWLLCSPSHVLLSRFALGIRVRGRVTGCTYTLPVNYLQNGFTLLILSPRTSTWWRNLQPQAPVTFWLRGYRLKVTAQALTDPEDVIKGLLVFLRRSPRYQWSLGVPLDGHGDPRQKAQLARAASHYTLIRIPLSTAPQAVGMAPAAEENTGGRIV
jgi:hypothetical protein